jgi:hypothetical protein
MKRVASAVGEGGMAVAFVHEGRDEEGLKHWMAWVRHHDKY